MAVIKIDIPDGKFLAVVINSEGKRHIIIGDGIDETFRQTREKDRVRKIIYEDEIFKTYKGKK